MNEPLSTDIDLVDVHYYSNNDENAFFDWLKKMNFVTKIHGHINILTITVKNDLDEYDLRDLMALFYRYRIDMRSLVKFDRLDFHKWLHNKTAFWYSEMFGSDGA